jgi:quercetin dioxygenase-like cupin family protein
LAVHFNQSSVAAEPIGNDVKRQRLLTAARVKSTNILLDRLTLEAGAMTGLDVPAGNLAWFQVLEGETVFKRPRGEGRLTESQIVFLPPGFTGTLSTQAGAVLLYAEIPDAGRFDPAFAKNPPKLRVVDWTREPVLDSEHDARKRIYVVTPKLFGTHALKGEMIIYPPGTEAANHHHEGAEHFMYLTRGRGTAHANEEPFPVRKGDLVYYAERERHYFISEGDEDMVFVEFFVPGDYKTVWVQDQPSCVWQPTGRNMRGATPAREIKAHGGADAVSPQDV